MTTDTRNEDPDRAMEAFTKPLSISERLRAAADDIQFQGRPDPHDDKALLREAAKSIEDLNLSLGLRPAATRITAEADAEWQAFGQWLVTTFQPGAVEPAAVLCPGGEYESGAQFCRRALQLALERGAFTPAGLDLLGDLVARFSAALLEKLRKAAKDRGLEHNPWMRDDWRDDLIEQMHEHIRKGDPRDVAAYCAFAWHHGWSLNNRPDGFQDLVRTESQALSKYIFETFHGAAVDEASVAELDLRVPLASTALRLLKLAMSRGAFAPGRHIQTEAGPALLMAGEAPDLEAHVKHWKAIAQMLWHQLARIEAIEPANSEARRIAATRLDLMSLEDAVEPLLLETEPAAVVAVDRKVEFFRGLQDRGAHKGPTKGPSETP